MFAALNSYESLHYSIAKLANQLLIDAVTKVNAGTSKSNTVDGVLPTITKIITTVMSSLQEALKETITTVLNTGLRPQTQEDGMDTEGTVVEASTSHQLKIIDVVDEYVEREKHKNNNNLIFHNLLEPVDATSNEQWLEHS